MTPDRLLAWFPVVVRFAGLVGIVFIAVVWFSTGRIETLLAGIFMTMMGLGQAFAAIAELSHPGEAKPEKEKA